MRKAVESAHPEMPCTLPELFFESVPHFSRSLVGKSHCEYCVCWRVFYLYQPGNSMHQYTRLAATCARENQLVFGWRADSFALRIIERVKQ
jgi:hypothetical protein